MVRAERGTIFASRKLPLRDYLAAIAWLLTQPRTRPKSRNLGGMDKALLIYNHARRTVANVAQSGWRPSFGWLGVAVGYFAFIYAPAHGIVVDAGAVNIFLTMVTSTFVVRGAEKFARDRNATMPGGGLVNPHAFEPSA